MACPPSTVQRTVDIGQEGMEIFSLHRIHFYHTHYYEVDSMEGSFLEYRARKPKQVPKQ